MHLSGFVYLSVFVFSLYQLPWAIILKSIPLGVSETHIFCPVIACICHRWHLQLSQGCYLILSFVTPGYHSDTIMASYPPTSHLTITWHSRSNVQPSFTAYVFDSNLKMCRCACLHMAEWTLDSLQAPTKHIRPPTRVCIAGYKAGCLPNSETGAVPLPFLHLLPELEGSEFPPHPPFDLKFC